MGRGDRSELAAALRQWRERRQPSEMGVPVGVSARRTPGLRREEVAGLAGVSVDYVVRLEQGRGPCPSARVLGDLALALGLSDAETDHLFTVADVPQPDDRRISDEVRPSIAHLLDRMGELPAMVVNARGDVLAWNDLAVALLGDFGRVPPHRRTHLWLHFVADETFTSRLVGDAADMARLDRSTVAQARAALARYPHDRRLRATVRDLLERSPRFRGLWDQRPIQSRHHDTKTYDVPGIGRITLDCESLAVPDDDHELVMYSAVPDSPDARKLDRLRASIVRTRRPSRSGHPDHNGPVTERSPREARGGRA